MVLFLLISAEGIDGGGLGEYGEGLYSPRSQR